MSQRRGPASQAPPTVQEFAELEEIARIGTWQWDVARSTLRWSEQLYRLAGRDPLLPPPTFAEHLALISPKEPRFDHHPVERVLETGMPVEFDSEIARPDRQRIWVFNRCIADRGPDGAVELLRGIVQDVTERKAAELVRDRLARIVDSADDGIIATDLNGTITAWNRGAQQMYGYSAAEVIGRSVDLLPPADRKGEPMALTERIRSGEPAIRLETVRSRKDGQIFECSLSLSPLRDEHGHLVGVSSIVRDMTEYKQTARKLLERETQFRAVLDQGIAGISILTTSGRVLYVNAGFARLCGHTPDDIIGRSFLEFVPAADHQRVVENFQRTVAGDMNQIEADIITRSGRLKSVLAHATRVQYGGKPALLGVAVDITDRKQAELALHRANRLLRTIGEGNEVLVRSGTEAELMQRMCDVIVTVGGYDVASIALLDADGLIHTAASAGEPSDRIRELEAARDAEDVDGGSASAIRTGEAQIHRDRACAYLPLKNHSGVFGSLGIYTRDVDCFAADEVALLTELADDLAYGIVALRHRSEREAFTERLQRSMEETIAALAATVEMRDPYTAGHQRHVAELAVAIAREMGLDESRVRAIHLASSVHDIGKIKIPSELLTKPDRLTTVEAQLMQTHVQAGYDILNGIDFPWPIAEVVRQHHERLDGSGYPRGLKAADIHLDARILTVADVVDAMSTNRPYRFGSGLDVTLASLESGRGVLYDADVVDACLVLFREKGFNFSPVCFA